MEPLDHDMDDLLRKAAADYPLKQGDSDWDIISGKLLNSPAVPPVSKNKKFRFFILFILALLLFMIVGGIFYYNTPLLEKKYKHTNNPLSGDSLKSIESGKRMKAGTTKIQPRKETIYEKLSGTAGKKELVKGRTPGGNNRSVSKDIFSGRTKNADTGNQNGNGSYSPSLILAQVNDSSNLMISEAVQTLKNTQVNSVSLIDKYSIHEPALHFSPVRLAGIHSQSQKGFYIGLNGGPELSKVGSQSTAKAGYHAGLLLGYRLNAKLSLELGILMGKKRYYSAGKYFNMSKLAALMPAGMEIMTVDGQSTQLEIPLSLKYDFLRRPQSAFFFTAGIVSHIYLQEKNNYETMLNGVQGNEVGMYKEDHFSLVSEAQISGGYEHRLGRSLRVRIEPYKKFPLRKSGMGSMPVFSSGVNVAVMLPLK